MQDRETFTIEDKKLYVAYGIAPIPMTLSDSHTSTDKWESACDLLFQRLYRNWRTSRVHRQSHTL